MNPAIDFKKYQKQKKEIEDQRRARINYYERLDGWDRKFMELYFSATDALDELFKHLNQEYRNSRDHLPEIVLKAMDEILTKLKK